MLIGYVSDERYVALPDAVLEFTEKFDGAKLTTESWIDSVYEKEGKRGGTMRFAEMVTEYKDQTGTVVAELGTVPNQPLAFTDSPDKKRFALFAFVR